MGEGETIFQGNPKKTIVLVVITSTLILVAVSEIILWFFLYVPKVSEVQSVERFMTQQIPGLKRNIKYTSGEYGLRSLSVVNYDLKPSNLIRILCLGASTTEQPTQETQDMWCGMIETKLRKHYAHLSIKFQTTAFGKAGYRALDNALWMKENFDTIKPDIVITLLGVNDLWLNGGKDYKYYGRIVGINKIIETIFEETMQEKLKKDIKYYCEMYSQICRRVVRFWRNSEVKEKMKTGEIVEWHSANLPSLRKQYQKYPYVESLIRNPDPINEFRDSVNWLVAYLKDKGAEVLLLGQPVLWKESFEPNEYNSLWFHVNTPEGRVRPSGAWLKGEMARYNSVQEALAKQAEVTYLDLDKRIPKTLKYYFDDCHYTDLGSKTVANAVLPALIKIVEKVTLKKDLTKP